MHRTVEGFRQDDEGDWVAELSCLHGQHVRDRPPLWPRPWVTTEAGRSARIGSDLDCSLCERLELPEGLSVVRTAGPFDAETLPPGLRRTHSVADRTWGRLRVLDGTLRFEIETEPPRRIRLHAGDDQAIPPGMEHRVHLDQAVRLVIDFLVRSTSTVTTPSSG